ncbi:MAG: hypothetical protein WCQ47_02085 [bacterium]
MERAQKKEKALFVVIIVFSILLFLWLKLEVVKLGFEHQDYLKIKKEALEENKMLRLQYADILSPSKIEQNAKDNFGLSEPKEKQIRYIDK